jgi:GTP-binding protein
MGMIITDAEFISSFPDYKQCPKPVIPEYAFIGRSNVGKSSLLNMLTNRKKLAKVSVTPGKTQTINHFKINNSFYITDLPGYGYAKVSKTSREKFSDMIVEYLLHRENLMNVFVLIDSRLPLQQVDDEFMKWLGEKEIPFSIVFTKIDKLGTTQIQKNYQAFEMQMLKWWEEMPRVFFTSSEKKAGGEEIIDFMRESNSAFVLPPK